MILLLIPTIRYRTATAEHRACETERLNYFDLLWCQQLDRLITNSLRLLGQLLERNVFVAPLANGLLDRAMELLGLRSFDLLPGTAHRGQCSGSGHFYYA